MDVTAFAAQRNARMEASDEILRPAVAAALLAYANGESDWADEVLDAAGRAWLENFQAEAPGAPTRAGLDRFRRRLATSLEKTMQPDGAPTDGQVDRIARWASTFAVNSGTTQGAFRRGVRNKRWVTVGDASVRDAHAAANGQVVAIGGAFSVGGVKMGYPGEPVGPPENWINCRCVAMPSTRSGETMSIIATAMQDTPGLDEDLPEPEDRTGALVVLLPAESDPISAASSEDMAHLTFVWMGDVRDLDEGHEASIAGEISSYASIVGGPVVVPVRERGPLGDEGADVVFLEPSESLIALRDGLMETSAEITRAHDAAEQFPEWTPHVTLGYPENIENGPAVGEYDGESVTFDRFGLWLGGVYTEYPFGGVVDDEAEELPDDDMDEMEGEFSEDDFVDEVPVHGVLAPEGIETGDGRGFRPGALSTRPLPLPLRLEIVGSHGGNQTSEVVTVGRIDEAWRDEATSMWRFRGVILAAKKHSDLAIESIIDGSGTGVSIDADAMAVDTEGFSEEDAVAAEAAGKQPTTWFSETQVAGLTIVPIPAFYQAYIGIGPDFLEDLPEEAQGEIIAASAAAEEDCGCNAATETLSADGETFAPGTKDGPGWITHPVPTSRIRRYWTQGKGAAKIRWKTPGDFTRCERLLRKYVQNPQWLAGLCANMHKEATGIWPGDRRNRRMSLIADGGTPAPVMTLVAAGGLAAEPDVAYPAEWFQNPQFDRVTPLTIDKETGRIWGHLAQWNVCHIGVAGTCVKPPRSASKYANFLKGVVDTTDGEQLVGCLTYGIGHANPRMRAAAATAHYDRPEAVVAYVNVGEDKHGIWYSGVLRPGVDRALVDEFRALGAISGDWRPVGRYGLDLVASVAVNTPGFPVSIAASGGEVTAIIAAAMVPQEGLAEEREVDEFDVSNPAAFDAALGAALARREEREKNHARRDALSSRVLTLRREDARRRIERI